jgi:hypothetical protein
MMMEAGNELQKTVVIQGHHLDYLAVLLRGNIEGEA